MTVFDYIWLGILAVFQGPEAFSLFGVAISTTIVMVLSGFLLGIAVGATPGLAGPMAMAISLPILISVFGFSPDALLPVMGFLIGIMKGATIGGGGSRNPVQHARHAGFLYDDAGRIPDDARRLRQEGA